MSQQDPAVPASLDVPGSTSSWPAVAQNLVRRRTLRRVRAMASSRMYRDYTLEEEGEVPRRSLTVKLAQSPPQPSYAPPSPPPSLPRIPLSPTVDTHTFRQTAIWDDLLPGEKRTVTYQGPALPIGIAHSTEDDWQTESMVRIRLCMRLTTSQSTVAANACGTNTEGLLRNRRSLDQSLCKMLTFQTMY